MTFFSDSRQPEADFLHSWTVVLTRYLHGQIVSIRVKTLGNTICMREGMASVLFSEKRLCLRSLILIYCADR